MSKGLSVCSDFFIHCLKSIGSRRFYFDRMFFYIPGIAWQSPFIYCQIFCVYKGFGCFWQGQFYEGRSIEKVALGGIKIEGDEINIALMGLPNRVRDNRNRVSGVNNGFIFHCPPLWLLIAGRSLS